MCSFDFFLVALISAYLVTTKMAASQSTTYDVKLTSSSSTSPAAAAAATDCFNAISQTNVCSTRVADDLRQNDVEMTSQSGNNVTTFSTRPLSNRNVTTASDDDVTSGASSCVAATPRKSETDWGFRWNFSQGHSYLNLTLEGDSRVVSGGYFVVLSSRCDGLRWRVRVVGNDLQVKTLNIVSRRSNSTIDGATTFWFNLESSIEAKEIDVAFAGQQHDATAQPDERGVQQNEQPGQPNNCGLVVDIELFHPCYGSTEAGVVGNDSTTTYGTTVEHGTPAKSSSSEISQRSTKLPNAPGDIQELTTPFPSSTETTLTKSTETSPQKTQNYKSSFRIRNQDFDSNLLQDTTQEFRSLYSRIYPLLNGSYSLTCGPFYGGIQRIAFRSGSIVVDNWFEILGTFDDQSRNKSSAFIVDEFGRNGMDVDPTSFEFATVSGGNTKDDQPQVENLLLIVVVSTVLGVLLIVLIVTAFLLIWRKTRKRVPVDEEETERQRADSQDERTRDVISGMPRSHLMWQNMPSLKAGFDDQSLFVYELPTSSPPKTHSSSTRALPSASTSSFSSASTSSSSSSPRNFLHYSNSHPSSDPRHNQSFYLPRPRTIAESTHASFSGITRHGFGNSQHGKGNSQNGEENSRHGGGNSRQGKGNSQHGEGNSQHGWGNSENDGAETSQVWGQLPLDYNSVTHDYFVGGPSNFSTEPAKKRNIFRSQSSRPWSRSTKFSSRKGSSVPDAVDFGNVFLPSTPPFQLADVLRCYEPQAEDVERSCKPARRSTSVDCRAGGKSRMDSDEFSVSKNTSCGKCGHQNGLEDRCSTDRCCCDQSDEHVTSPTQSPHASGSITNSQVNLISALYTKSPKKKRNLQMHDNIHRSTMLSLADEAFYQIPGLS